MSASDQREWAASFFSKVFSSTQPVCGGVLAHVFFATAVECSKKMAGNVILIYSSPHAVDFYAHLGATKIGVTPFVFSPDIPLTMFAFTIPASSGAGAA
jgi:hypothetical protein